MTAGRVQRWGAVCLLLAWLLSGCWDNQAINRRALVLLIGVAPYRSQEVTVWFQIPTPQGLTTLTTPTASGPTFLVLRGHGPTLAAAFAEAQSQINQDLYLGQTQAVILSAALSSSQWSEVLNSLERIGTLDKSAWVLVTQRPLQAVFQSHPPTAPLPGLYFETLFGCTSCQTVALHRTLWGVEKRWHTPSVDEWLPLLSVQPDGWRVDQVVLYQHGRPKRRLDPGQTLTLGYLLGRTHKGWLVVRGRWGVAGLRGLRAWPQWTTSVRGQNAEVRVVLKVRGKLATFPIGAFTPAVAGQVRTAAAKLLAGSVDQLLAHLQSLDIDPVGFGLGWAWAHPQAASEWPRLWRHAHVTVTVHLQIVETGGSR